MLTYLQIQNFIIIDQVNIDIEKGLTVITGETGAGKSIMMDALSLILGGRADNNLVGPFADKCHLTACFDLHEIPLAQTWLTQNDFAEHSGDDCIIRRVLQRDGKSRQFINGYTCTTQQLRDLVSILVNIHSQHQQQSLVRKTYQRELLDVFANHSTVCDEVRNRHDQWSNNQKQIQYYSELQKNGAVQKELLEYQIEEFTQLALQPSEYEQLDQEQKQLANAGQLISSCQQALGLLSENDNKSAQDILYAAHHNLACIQQFDDRLKNAVEFINNSIIHLDEASSELRSYINQLELNPERLAFCERRLSAIHELARKYQVHPLELPEMQQNLERQLSELIEAHDHHTALQKKAVELETNYREVALKLHKSRAQAAQLLSDKITLDLQSLGMPGGTFQISVEPCLEFSSHGIDNIDFLVATNPGQSLQLLGKTASGGETSRIALALYVAIAQKNTIPVLVFDEVDVGISGSTAAIVGRLLKEISKTAQVLCITHLPQVAAYGDQHLTVKKIVDKNQTATSILTLDEESRILEIARMLGGITITDKTLAHAKELVSDT